MSSKSIKRIIQDLKSLDTKSLEQNNIYYFHDEENIFRGYAMIIYRRYTILPWILLLSV